MKAAPGCKLERTKNLQNEPNCLLTSTQKARRPPAIEPSITHTGRPKVSVVRAG